MRRQQQQQQQLTASASMIELCMAAAAAAYVLQLAGISSCMQFCCLPDQQSMHCGDGKLQRAPRCSVGNSSSSSSSNSNSRLLVGLRPTCAAAD
uniref:Uncharacterized protein n=1 Tax=Tetradesmus obliquus TaxID=3088 RepID=A0A383W679_TETOB